MGDAAVVVLGSLNIDHVANVERLPVAGETLLADDYAVHMGGKGRNQAVAVARLGGRVALVGAVGDDAGGATMLADLARHGVDATHVVTVPGRATGLALITVDSQGENTIVVHPGANSQVPTLMPGVLDGHAVMLCSLEIPLAVVADATARARAAGVTTVVNAAPMRGLRDGTLQPVLDHADLVVFNESEARELVGAGAGEQVEALLAAWRPAAVTVILTLGARGALVFGDLGVTRVPSPEVTAVNTVGAGDTFAGMLALALAGGRPVGDAAALACAAGAIAVSRPGDLSAESVAALLQPPVGVTHSSPSRTTTPAALTRMPRGTTASSPSAGMVEHAPSPANFQP